ncbi:MAG: hypothetical protein WCJ61_06765, partial [Paludibacter sp.]
MLNKYRGDIRISQIIGTNFLGEWKINQQSYFFSLFSHTWGWASWRRVWIQYDFEIKKWDDIDNKKILENRISNSEIYGRLKDLYDYTKSNILTITWWDFQWLFCMQISNGLCIVPVLNLIKNIGVGEDATHTKNLNTTAPSLKKDISIFPITHNTDISPDYEFDRIYFKKAFQAKPSLFVRLFKNYKLIIKQLKLNI